MRKTKKSLLKNNIKTNDNDKSTQGIIAYFFKFSFCTLALIFLLFFLISNMEYVNNQKANAIQYMKAKNNQH